jgi:hypothetical protein
MTRSQLPYYQEHSEQKANEATATNSCSYTNWPPRTMRTDFSVFAKLHFARTRFSVVKRSIISERSKSGYKVQNLILWFVRMCFVGMFVEDKINSQSTIFRDANSEQLLWVSWNQTPFKKPEEFFQVYVQNSTKNIRKWYLPTSHSGYSWSFPLKKSFNWNKCRLSNFKNFFVQSTNVWQINSPKYILFLISFFLRFQLRWLLLEGHLVY